MPLFHESLFWKINQLAILAIWVLLIYINLDTPNWMYQTFLLLFLISHLMQFLFVSRKISRFGDFTASQIAVLTLLLGYSWWVPQYLERKKEKGGLQSSGVKRQVP